MTLCFSVVLGCARISDSLVIRILGFELLSRLNAPKTAFMRSVETGLISKDLSLAGSPRKDVNSDVTTLRLADHFAFLAIAALALPF